MSNSLRYERIAIAATLQLAAIEIFERAVQWLFSAALSPHSGSGPTMNMVLTLLTWALAVVAASVPVVWYFAQAEPSFFHGLVLGIVTAVLTLMVHSFDIEFAVLTIVISTAYATFKGAARARSFNPSAPF